MLIPETIPKWFWERYSIDDSVRFVHHPRYCNWEKAIIRNVHWIKIEALFREGLQVLDDNARVPEIIAKHEIAMV